jgi:3-hydroxybutyrate dehydrogenase
LVGFTKSVALETATTGVTVNAICPGWVLTPLVQKQIDAKAQQGKLTIQEATTQLLAEKQPSAEFVQPDQIAELVVFLCSPAADNVRGAAWNIDGGWFAQ